MFDLSRIAKSKKKRQLFYVIGMNLFGKQEEVEIAKSFVWLQKSARWELVRQVHDVVRPLIKSLTHPLDVAFDIWREGGIKG